MHTVQAISNHQLGLLRSAGTWQAAAHSQPICVPVLIVAAALRLSQSTGFTCCQREVDVIESESGVAVLSLSFKPTSFIHDAEVGEWHPGQCIQIV